MATDRSGVGISPPPARPVGRFVLGGLLVLAGALWLAERADWIALSPGVVLAVALFGLGVALLALAFDGPHTGLVVAGGFLAAATLVVAVVEPLDFARGGVGDRRYQATTLADLRPDYHLGIGTMTLDLGGLVDLPAGDSPSVTATVGLGELRVSVPSGMLVEVRASAGAGEVVLFGTREAGVGVDQVYTSPAFEGAESRMRFDLRVIAGRVEVVRR